MINYWVKVADSFSLSKKTRRPIVLCGWLLFFFVFCFCFWCIIIILCSSFLFFFLSSFSSRFLFYEKFSLPSSQNLSKIQMMLMSSSYSASLPCPLRFVIGQKGVSNLIYAYIYTARLDISQYMSVYLFWAPSHVDPHLL